MSVACFSIQTIMPQMSTIQICYDIPVSLRVPFINGAHLQVATVCCSQLIHLLYLTLLIFYTNYKWCRRAAGAYGWLFFPYTLYLFSRSHSSLTKRTYGLLSLCFVIGDNHQFCILFFTYYSYFTCGFFSILDEFSLNLSESQNLHFYGWNKFRGSTIFRYPYHNSTESVSLQQMLVIKWIWCTAQPPQTAQAWLKHATLV